MGKTKDGRIKRGTRVSFRGEGVVWRSDGTRADSMVQIDVPPVEGGKSWESTIVVRNCDIVDWDEED